MAGNDEGAAGEGAGDNDEGAAAAAAAAATAAAAAGDAASDAAVDEGAAAAAGDEGAASGDNADVVRSMRARINQAETAQAEAVERAKRAENNTRELLERVVLLEIDRSNEQTVAEVRRMGPIPGDIEQLAQDLVVLRATHKDIADRFTQRFTEIGALLKTSAVNRGEQGTSEGAGDNDDGSLASLVRSVHSEDDDPMTDPTKIRDAFLRATPEQRADYFKNRG